MTWLLFSVVEEEGKGTNFYPYLRQDQALPPGSPLPTSHSLYVQTLLPWTLRFGSSACKTLIIPSGGEVQDTTPFG